METNHKLEVIHIPASGRVRLDLSLKVANQTQLSASYVLVSAGRTGAGTAPKELLEAWEQVKHRIEQYEIQSGQITRWFLRHYGLDTDLDDLTSDTLPAKFTTENLRQFSDAIDRYMRSPRS